MKIAAINNEIQIKEQQLINLQKEIAALKVKSADEVINSKKVHIVKILNYIRKVQYKIFKETNSSVKVLFIPLFDISVDNDAVILKNIAVNATRIIEVAFIKYNLLTDTVNSDLIRFNLDMVDENSIFHLKNKFKMKKYVSCAINYSLSKEFEKIPRIIKTLDRISIEHKQVLRALISDIILECTAQERKLCKLSQTYGI